MKNKTLKILILLLITNLSTGYAQKNIVCKGTITDAGTNKPLNDVLIYSAFNGDTVLYKSNAAGTFQMSLQTGSKLLLKKAGYTWQFFRAYNNDIQHIKMTRSKPQEKLTIIKADGKAVENLTVTFDGQPVTESEWDDAMSIDFKEVNFGIKTNKDGSTQFYIETR